MKSWRIALIGVTVAGSGWGAAQIGMLPSAWPALKPAADVRVAPAEASRPLLHYLPVIK
ncbi:hypothetical protein [Sphingobium ummariense]